MADESRFEQIVVDIIAALSAITAGADYHYQPDAVVPVEKYSKAHLDTSKGIIYFVRDSGDETALIDQDEFGREAKECEVFVLACYLDQRSTTNPFDQPTPLRRTIRNRMVRDIEKKLAEDYRRSDLAVNTQLTDVRRAIADAPEAWVVAELAFRIIFVHDPDSP